MIGAAKGITEDVLNNLLEYAFNALIFCVSLSELKHNKNVEQLKRELKVSLSIKSYQISGLRFLFLFFIAAVLSDSGQTVRVG